MRGIAVTFIVLLLVPLAASAALPARIAPSPVPTLSFADLDDGMSDAQLLRTLAAKDGLTLPVVALPALDPTLDIAPLLVDLASRSGASLSPAEARAFNELDPRVKAPVGAMLVAIQSAWDLRDDAMSSLTPEERTELLMMAGQAEPDPARAAYLVSQVEKERIYAAAILLLDTAEGIVLPAVQEAVALGVWPPIAIADPAGVLRIGSMGNDVEMLDRILQIDPAGNDVYRNNAGATNFNDVLFDPHPFYPIAVSIDVSGDDQYLGRDQTVHDIGMESQGAATVPGVGLLLDMAGVDAYECRARCQGSGNLGGIGLLRDNIGEDQYTGYWSMGFAGTGGTGVLREERGHDRYLTFNGGGRSDNSAMNEPGGETGILWDRAGDDRYESTGILAWGFSRGWGRGWLADEGAGADFYSTEFLAPSIRHGCNDCEWRIGYNAGGLTGRPEGRGVDNSGGLSYLLATNGLTP